jgi:hypothetical protein
MGDAQMLDMFGANNTNDTEIYSDLFGTYQQYDKFFWSVGIFAGNGATEAIKYALDARLEVFYPHHLNKNGDFVPLWKNYLFIEWIDNVSVSVCRKCNKFIKFISFDENNRPFLVGRNNIDECLEMLKMGKYNIISKERDFYPAGSVVMIRDDNYFDRMWVKLLCDIGSFMNGKHRVPVELNGWKINIEINKLFL